MADLVVIDELHVTLLVPARSPASECRQIIAALGVKRLRRLVQTALHKALPHRDARKLSVRVSR